MAGREPTSGDEAGRLLAQAIVDTIREPLLVLDRDLRVTTASRSFYETFQVGAEATEGRLLGDLGERQWDIGALQTLLARVAPDKLALEDYEITRDVPGLGQRTFLLNARKIFYKDNHSSNILLTFEDVTERRAVEHQRDDLLRQKDLLLAEMQHRVANSLSIIASILMLKARTVPSAETRAHLEDAHRRVLSVAAVQQHLHPTHAGQPIDVGLYLKELCASLAGSMINDDNCRIDVHVMDGHATSAAAVSVGLIATELVINALKHAFPAPKSGCVVDVSYEANGADWKLTVADNGVGRPDGAWPPVQAGLGTSIVNALAEQLEARVDTQSGPSGTIVSVARSTFKPRDKAA